MEIIKALNAVTAQTALPFDHKIAQLLKVGCQFLNMEIGVVGQIDSANYTVMGAWSPTLPIQPGMCLPASSTYCRHTLNRRDVVAYHDTAMLPPDQQATPNSHFRRYIGMRMSLDAHHATTVCICSTQPGVPFSEQDHTNLMLVAEWVGAEFNRKSYVDGLLAQQHQLAHQNELFDQMAQLARVGSWEHEVLTGTTYWSQSLRDMFGLPKDFVVDGNKVWEFVAGAGRGQALKEEFQQHVAQGLSFSAEAEIIGYSGRQFWIQFQSKPIFDDGRLLKVIGATQDITSRVEAARELEKKRQVAERALHSRSLFLANMSHEIRTPINGVLGMLTALGKTPLNEQQREFCQVAATSADTLLALVNDILDFSKIDAGQLELEGVPMCVGTLIEEQHSVFAHLAREKGLEVTCQVAPGVASPVIGDPTRLRQVLINLINNAIKFTRQGSVGISANVVHEGRHDLTLQICVSDSGIGIAPERLKAIFTPFAQEDSATTRQFGGTGLGLSIVAQIVEQMGGQIEVDSTPGQGTRFSLLLPFERSPEPAVSRAENPEVTATQLAGLPTEARLLVVEDNDINQIVITEQLKSLGLSADIANNGSEAVRRVKHALHHDTLYDVVLMDCQMPVMDGYAATEAIRKLGGAAASMPIIALTANALAGERQKCHNAGMNDYLTKPVDGTRLASCLHHYLCLATELVSKPAF